MRRGLLLSFSLALVLVALPLRVEGQECRSGYLIATGDGGWVCVEEEQTGETIGLQSAFLGLFHTLENAIERVLNEMAEQ